MTIELLINSNAQGFVCAECCVVFITLAFVRTLIWVWKNMSALVESNKASVCWLITLNYNARTAQWTTHTYTYRCSLHKPASIKWCVRYPAVKSTAEYGVLPFREKDIHWSLPPDIKEYWCYTPQGLVLGAQMERNRRPWRNLTPVTPPHDFLLHWKALIFSSQTSRCTLSAVGRPSLTSSLKSMLSSGRSNSKYTLSKVETFSTRDTSRLSSIPSHPCHLHQLPNLSHC